jgi:pyruvate/2-oxoglutarate dehydrogenase complex dihydrolipoamide acyltransferase (E2) component
MKSLRMQLEKIRTDAAECLYLAADGKPELFATLHESLNALVLQVEETIATSDERAARFRQMLLWGLGIVLVTVVGAAFFWATEENSSSVAVVQSRPASSPASKEDAEQATIGLLLSSYQGERKILTEQLGALTGRVQTLERALDNLERARRAEIMLPSNKQSASAEGNPTAAETKPARTEENRATAPEKTAAAEKNADVKQSDDAPLATGNLPIEPVDQVGATPAARQAELDLHKRSIGSPACTRFRSFDPVSGTYTGFDGRRRPCRPGPQPASP